MRSPARPPQQHQRLPIGASLPVGASPKEYVVQKPNEPTNFTMIKIGSIVSVLTLSINMKVKLINATTRMAKFVLPNIAQHEASQLQNESLGMWCSLDKLAAF